MSNKITHRAKAAFSTLTNRRRRRRIALHDQDTTMLKATTSNSSPKRFLSAINLSLLVLVLLFLSVMVHQKALGPSPAERGFVGKVEQIVAASYTGSLKLHKDHSPKDDNPEPNPSLHWVLVSHVGLFSVAPQQIVTSSYSQRYTLSPAPAYLSPPLRAPPSA